MPAAHITQLLKNSRGNDYIIGDVHGCNVGLRAVIDALKTGDRLFLVGDLFDRGPDSIDVFNAIIESIREGKRIYAVRGNHEDMFLKALPVLKYFNNNPSHTLTTTSKQIIYNFLRNGGSWIFSQADDQELYEESKLRNTTYDSLVFDNHFFSKPLCQELDEIESYVDSLPYIILVGDINDKKNSFITCHAAMPFDDETLRQRLVIANNPLYMQLQPAEIQYVTWERPDHPALSNRSYNSKRVADSLLVYCGHSILSKYPPYKTRVVRHDTSHVNLDAGAYLDPDAQLFLRMNHTEGKADVIMGSFHLTIAQCVYEIEFTCITAEIERYIHLREVNLQRADLIQSLNRELRKHFESVRAEDIALETFELRLLCHNQAELGTPLLGKGKRAIKHELVAMIRELERLIHNNGASSYNVWQPGPLATEQETCCCFFSRPSVLNSFYEQVVQLGGRPFQVETGLVTRI